MNGARVMDLFRERRVAAILAGPWVLTNLRGQASPTDLLPGSRIVSRPNPPSWAECIWWSGSRRVHFEEVFERSRYWSPRSESGASPI